MTPEDAGTPDRLTIPGSVGASDGPVPAGGAASLGRSGVRVTALSFGGAAIGGLYTPVPAERAAATVRRALDRGVRYLDTAPHYGAGRAERRLGAVLAAEPPGSYVVSTKVGRRLVPSVPGEPPESDGFADPPRSGGSGTGAATASGAPWRSPWSGWASTGSTSSTSTTPTSTRPRSTPPPTRPWPRCGTRAWWARSGSG
nr:hypothetical protein GCM10020093_069920 [Planobispora longispora]